MLSLLAGASLSACGRDTGILVSVTTEAGVQVDTLTMSVGSDDGQPDRYVQRPENVDVVVDVAGRDLIGSPYSVMFQPSKIPAEPLYVAVVGTLAGQAVAFGSFPRSQPFMADEILMRTITLKAAAEGQDFSRTPTGCLTFGGSSIAPETDRDCDGYTTPQDCDDTDSAVHPGAPELCGNMRDDNCDGQIDEGCAMPVCKPGETRPCYTGPANTSGKGVCRDGVESCISGQWGQCTGQVTPTAESCNGLDDNCDGTADNGLPSVTCGIGECAKTQPSCVGGMVPACIPNGLPANTDESVADGKDNDCDGAIDEDVAACVRVAPTGNDTAAAADATGLLPFLTIQGALTAAKADATRPKMVCVAAGAACGASANYVFGTMENGYSVYGNYESTTWKRCDAPATPSITTLKPAAPEGVVFPSTINSLTVLDGFVIERVAGSNNAGITLLGATHAQISNISIPPSTGVNTIGINLLSGAQALITRSSIFAGSGTTLSAGIMSTASTPTLRSNCSSFDTRGRCQDFCTNLNLGIRGRLSNAGGSANESYSVLLKDSPNALIDTSALCSAAGNNVGALRVMGSSPGVLVRASVLAAGPGIANAHGAWLEECGGKSPWVLDNYAVEASGVSSSSKVSGVRAVGNCHPVIELNFKIVGGSEAGASSGTGVYCGENGAGVHSDCVILDNGIDGSQGGFPTTAVAVDCDRGCAQVFRNTIDGKTGVDAIGVRVIRYGTLIDSNIISGGCGSASSVGVRSDDSYARVQNNRIRGGSCVGMGTVTGKKFVGMRVTAAMGFNEVDVHSNTIDGGGQQSACDSVAVELGAGSTGPGAPRGIYRNNIVRGGLCTNARYDMRELDTGADPRLLENQDFDPSGAPILYLNENTTQIAASGLDMLTGAKGNISVDPLFVSYPSDLHLTSVSMCIGKGTPTGAPARDMDGQTRKATPDIGADEK